MKEWLQRIIYRTSVFVRRIFAPILLVEGGTVLLVETPSQILTRKVVAVALGSLAVILLTTPTTFAFDEMLAVKIGDWLAQTANILWNYTGAF